MSNFDDCVTELVHQV